MIQAMLPPGKLYSRYQSSTVDQNHFKSSEYFGLFLFETHTHVPLYIYICIYIYIYLYIYLYIYICLSLSLYIYIYIYVNIYMCVCVHVCMYVQSVDIHFTVPQLISAACNEHGWIREQSAQTAQVAV